MQIEQYARGRVIAGSRKKGSGVRKSGDPVACQRKNDRERIAYHDVVVNDEQLVCR
jgi:hypothetical protein